MNREKIAILVDSCVDVPPQYVKKYGMYVIPLKIIYKDREYSDGVDITAQEVYDRLHTEIPTTSLPASGEINAMFDRIKADGYKKVLAVSLSSGLSGTYNSIRLLGNQYEGLDVFALDTKNIGIASGFNAIQAAEYIEEGMDWDTLINTVTRNVPNSKVFFYVDTLEYLKKGGRIGLVTSTLGSALHLKPIISCNDDGIYYTISKTLGRKRAFKKAMSLAVDFAKDSKKYNVAIVHGGAKERADKIKEVLMPMLPHCNIYTDGQISPVLGVHTGPGTIGIAIQLLDR